VIGMDSCPSLLQRAAAIVAAAALVVSSTGCSFVAGSTQRFRVTTEPSGARVYVNGQDYGTSPIDVRIDRRENAQVVARMKGYLPTARSTSRDISTIGVIDMVGGVIVLVPFLGLIADGAYVQTPKQMHVHLSPVDESVQ